MRIHFNCWDRKRSREAKTREPKEKIPSLRFLFRLLLFVCFFSSNLAHAQFDSAAVLGTVRDSSGAIISSAQVVLNNPSKGLSFKRQTDSNGDYQFPNVQIGEYFLTANASGFQETRTEKFTVTVNSRQRVDLTLTVGSTSQSVTVTGAAALLETDTSDRGEVVSQREMTNLPLNGRAYADLALLVPGVRKSSIEDGTITSRDASYDVNGMRSMVNNFLLDGLDNNAYQEANQGYSNQAVIPSPDALQEFRVQTDNYAAEYGRAAGAIINASFKSGTNQFHGSAYDYLRNTVLNAYGPFRGTGVKPTLVQNQFGATVGGPIRKDRLFFFMDYEGLRHVDKSLQSGVLPTMSQRSGQFVDAGGSAVKLVNPVTGAKYNNGVIPASEQSVFAQTVMAALPAPNQTGVALGAVNYVVLSPNTVEDNKGDIRVDSFFGTKATAFGRYSQREYTIVVAPLITGPAGGNSNGTLYARTRQIASGYTYNLSATSLIEARLGFTWTESGKNPYNLGATNLVTLPNAPTAKNVVGGLNSQIVGGFAPFGRQTTNPQFTNPFHFTPKINYTAQVGRHTIKTGYEYGWLTQAIDDFNPKYGADTYNGQFSRASGAQTSNAALTGVYDLADFLLGARSHYELNNVAEANYYRRWHFLYAQDDWKATGRLSLNYGLRYEFMTPYWEGQNRLTNFDPTTDSLVYAKSGSIASRALVNPQFNNLAPRLGFSLQLDPKTVLRGGYAISYIQYFRYGSEGLLAFNGPYIVDATIDQTPPCGPGAASKPLQLCGDNQDPTSCFRTTQQGYVSGFASSSSFSTLKAQTRYLPKDSPTGYAETTHLDVQRQLNSTMLLDVAWVWNHGVHVLVLGDYNQAAPQSAGCITSSAACQSLQARRPISNFTNILETFGAGFLQYHALQVKLEKRYSQGLFLLNSFTWSHGIDNASSDLETANGDRTNVNIYNILGDRGRSGYDQPLNSTTSLVWDLPFGRGRRFGANAPFLLAGALGGWQVTAINTVTSGLPVNLSYSPVTNAIVTSTSATYAYRPNLTGKIGDVYAPRSTWVKTNSQLTGAYNKSAVAIPAINQPFGNAGRNSMRGPAFGQMDLGVHKKFPLWNDASAVEFRTEAFNVLNATNYQSPNSSVGSSSFGSYTSAYPSRQIQVALRLSF